MHAMRHSVRIVESGDHKIGYIHTWSYSVERYHELFVDTLFGGELNDVDGLLLDIRDGWGGASPEYLNLFHRQMPQLSMKRRGQPWEHFGKVWRRPVALLINERAWSGKEVYAYGFRKILARTPRRAR